MALHYRTSREEAEEALQAILKTGGEAALFQNPLADHEPMANGSWGRSSPISEAQTRLINNAGTFNRKRFEELTQSEWEEGFASTAGSAFIATRAALPSFADERARA